MAGHDTGDQKISMDERSLYLRQLVVKAAQKAGRGHIGGAMSVIEILRVLYDDVMRYRSHDPSWEDRDRFILSKGHACLGLYVLLADKGFFPMKELDRCFKKGAMLGGHPERGKIPGVEASTGALGHGLPMAAGMALAARIKKKSHRIFVVLGDGESQEGSVWEAAMFIAKHRLTNVLTIVDYNKVQASGAVKDVLDISPLADKWRSFGFEVEEVDGHHVKKLKEVFSHLPSPDKRPGVVICHTVKCKGIPFAENDAAWHYKRVDAQTIARMYTALGEQ